MAWTNPVTWSANQVVKASDLNAQIRDNLNYLLAPSIVMQHTGAGVLTTTSTTFVSLGTAWALNLNTNGGYLLAAAQMLVSGNGVIDVITLGIDVDGTTYPVAVVRASSLNPVAPQVLKIVTGLASGAHVVTLKWHTNVGTLTAAIDPTVLPLEFWAKEA